MELKLKLTTVVGMVAVLAVALAAGTAAHQQVNAAAQGILTIGTLAQPVIHMMTVIMAIHTTQEARVVNVTVVTERSK